MHQPDKHQGNSKKSAACFYTLLSPSNGDYNRGNKDYNGDNHKPQKYWIRSISLYLQEIKNIPLLTPDEEKELAKKIKLGNNNALNKLVASNLRIVITIAKNHRGKGLSLDDLIQEGNLGLIQAAKRFDETQGYKFITYAVWWIHQRISQALEESRLISLPKNRIKMMIELNRAYPPLSQKLGRYPTPEEMSEATEIALKKIYGLQELPKQPLSLDSPAIPNSTDKILLEIIENPPQESPEELIDKKDLEEKIAALISSLPEKEKKVLELYYGFSEGGLFLEQIGNRMGVTGERIRQIKNKALTALRNSPKVKKLWFYLQD